MPISTIESLREHLQWALEIEHATIPPYLTALYSIHEGKNTEIHEVIQSIFMEEMLHMTLVANILNAIGGSPVLDKPDFIAQYPAYLPHSNNSFQVPLLKFSREALQTFLFIEKPEDHDALPEDDNYHTIGQFYASIQEALIRFSNELGESNLFIGDPTYQIRSGSTYYGGSGEIVAVENLETALEALEEIVEQGEGMQHEEVWDGDKNMFHPEREEVAHYFRILEVLNGRYYQEGDTPQSGPTGDEFDIDWSAVHNMRPNPRMEDYPDDSEIRVAMEIFNTTYSSILRIMQHAFNGQPEFLAIATGSMYELKHQAIKLMEMPSGDGETTVGTSFEYIPVPEHHIKQKIIVSRNGPYLVYGHLPLVNKAQVISEHGEPLTWRKGDAIPTEETYALCRCGQSGSKPFCDGTHARIRFDGTETADTTVIAERQTLYEGTGITVKHDNSLCMEAGFCGNRLKHLLEMVEESEESTVRAQAMAMVERCPSGAYSYTVPPVEENIEPSLPKEIAVTEEGELLGSLWVTGEISIERADGEFFETRNRVTLCRCGHSKNKPLCDGTHREMNITE